MSRPLESIVSDLSEFPFTTRKPAVFPRACYELPGQFASRASMTSAKTAKCIPFSVAASLS
jgi:hypothetical protein